jgi:hypothetical protein
MGEEKNILIDLHYLPSLEYFSCIMQFDKVVIEGEENFQKQTYRNRCYICGANKVEKLSIPVQKTGNKIPIREVKINYTQRWWKEHWRSIASAYGKAPFFEYYADIFEKIFSRKHAYLFEFNWELLTVCLDLMKLETKLSVTERYLKKPADGIFDARDMIRPHKNPVENGFYNPVPYHQVFGNIFAQNLSVIDLLFCAGPSSREILHKSIKAN